MCQVQATHYSRCNCTTRFRVSSPCKVGFSPSKLSCRGGDNEMIYSKISKRAICHDCYAKMEARLRVEYERKAQTVIDEGMSEKWQKRRLQSEVKGLKQKLGSELKRLKEVCGVLMDG